jgi:hypothetical protein
MILNSSSKKECGVLKSGTVGNSLKGTSDEFGRKNAKTGDQTSGIRPIPGHQKLILPLVATARQP